MKCPNKKATSLGDLFRDIPRTDIPTTETAEEIWRFYKELENRVDLKAALDEKTFSNYQMHRDKVFSLVDHVKFVASL